MRQHVVAGDERGHKTPFTVLVADKVRGRMAEKHRRQVDMAPLLGISQQSVSKRLNGKVPWDINELAVIADWLDTTVSALITVDAPLDAGEAPTRRYSADSTLFDVA